MMPLETQYINERKSRFLTECGILFLILGFLAGCELVSSPDVPSKTPSEGVQHSVRTSNNASTLSSGCVSDRQSSGALYEICVPEADTPPDTLLVYAHGYVFPQQPLALPNDELDSKPETVRDFVTEQGMAYAATSYYTNGVVEPEKGIKDLRELITIYTRKYHQPSQVVLVGFSNGGLLSTLALEQNPDSFDGLLASCGPVGSYQRQVDYFSHIFVLFNYFFPEVVRGGPDGVPGGYLEQLMQDARDAGQTPQEYLGGRVQKALMTHMEKTTQLLSVIHNTPGVDAPFKNPAVNPEKGIEEGITTVSHVMVYNVFATNDIIAKLGGPPFENLEQTYVGSSDDPLLNDQVGRYSANPDAAAHLASRYQPEGRVPSPLVSLHNTRDPIVPFTHQELYGERLDEAGYSRELIPVERFGHCDFTEQELGEAFNLLQNAMAAEPMALEN